MIVVLVETLANHGKMTLLINILFISTAEQDHCWLLHLKKKWNCNIQNFLADVFHNVSIGTRYRICCCNSYFFLNSQVQLIIGRHANRLYSYSKLLLQGLPWNAIYHRQHVFSALGHLQHQYTRSCIFKVVTIKIYWTIVWVFFPRI